MFNFFLDIHILLSFLLVVVILLQAGKGGGLASAFGGSGTSDAVFGGRQAAGFLGKATAVLGALFMLSAFGLALISSYTSGPRSVVQEQLQGNPAPITAPAPAAQPAGSDVFQGGSSGQTTTTPQQATEQQPSQPAQPQK